MFLLGGLPLISQYKKLADDERQTWDFRFAINKLTIKSFEGVEGVYALKYNLGMIYLVYILFIFMA